jgi:muramoyltetrapeptide carboxypeptidase
MVTIKPKVLKKGDTIGVFSPSYEPAVGRLARGVKAIERAGYKVILDPDIKNVRHYSIKEDKRYAEKFMKMWTDPKVDGIICSTGGYGAIRLIPFLDPEVFKTSPKIFVGYSDITALHIWLNNLGIITFHGPTVDDLTPSLYDPSFKSLLSAISTPYPTRSIGRDICQSIKDGKASGRLVGGNLSLIQQTIGTPYQIDTTDSILFIEETKEPMSVVDEKIIHFEAAGILKGVQGIVIGQLSLDISEFEEFENFLVELFAKFDVPILTSFPAGHDEPNFTLPFGTQVELVAAEGSGYIRYKESALTP